MTLKQALRPTNRRTRYLVGCLLIGLFCIQCIPTSHDASSSKVVIAKGLDDDPKEVAGKVLQLAKTDQIGLLKYCLANYSRRFHDYTCTLIKQERIQGVLGAEQEVTVKFLDSPFSVAMKWIRNAPIGDQVLYVEGRYDGKMIVRPKNGLFRLLTGGAVLRKPDGPDAMKNTLRPVNFFGFRMGMQELLKVYTQAHTAGDLDQVFGGYAEVAGRRTLVLERYLPPKDDYPAWKTVVYIDCDLLVPICIEGYDWEKQLTSRYVYKDLQFNVGLTSDDFLPEANGITLPKQQ